MDTTASRRRLRQIRDRSLGDLNPQPLEYPMWGTVTKISDENVKALAGLTKDIADHGGLNVAYDAFGIQPTDSLYVKPEDRVRIW